MTAFIWIVAVLVALWACELLGRIARWTFRWTVCHLRVRSATVVPIDDRRRQQLSALARGREGR